jgi:transposase InsO family protein
MGVQDLSTFSEPPASRTGLSFSIDGVATRVALDTGLTGWSLISSRCVADRDYDLTELAEPVRITNPLWPDPKMATKTATVAVTAGEHSTILDALVVDLHGEAELYISRDDMPLLGFQLQQSLPRRTLLPDHPAVPVDTSSVDELHERSARIHVDGATFTESTLPSGTAGPKIGTAFNSSNASGFESILAEVLELFDANLTSPDVGVNRAPIKLFYSGEGPGYWARAPSNTSQADALVLQEWVTAGVAKGIMEPYIPDARDPSARPPGHSVRANVFVHREKAKSKARTVINLKPINDNVLQTNLTMAEPTRLFQTVQACAGDCILSSLDLKSAFDQVRLSRDPECLAIYIVVLGVTYRLLCLPQGLVTSPFIFNALIEDLLAGIPGCETYFDDVCQAARVTRSADGLIDLSAYRSSLVLILQRLTGPLGFRLNPSKCTLFASSIDLGGWNVGKGRIGLTDSRMAQLGELQMPRTFRELKGILGFFAFLSTFGPDVAAVLSPAHKHANNKGYLDKVLTTTELEEVSSALIRAQAILKASPGLAAPDWELPFFLATDASRRGIAAVLLQRASDASTRIIAFGSRGLTEPESRYSAADLELLAVVFGFRKYDYYLTGRHFTLLTDHRALVGALGKADPSSLVCRWWDFISRFDFTTVHIPGITNILPDTLSRQRYIRRSATDNAELDRVHLDAPGALVIRGVAPGPPRPSTSSFATITAAPLGGGEELQPQLPAAPVPVPLEAKAKALAESYVDDYVQLYDTQGYPIPPREAWNTPRWHHGDPLRAPPVDDRKGILAREHNFGHLGAKGTTNRIHHLGWGWPGLQDQAQKVVDACLQCRRHSVRTAGYHPVSASVYDEVCPGAHWAIDLAQYPITPRGNVYLLIVVDIATRYCWAIPIKDKDAVTVASALALLALAEGFPVILSHDGGTEFVNAILASFTAATRIDKRTTAPYHARANGVCERTVGRVTDRVKRMMAATISDWDLFAPAAAYAVNTTVTEHTGSLPFELFRARPVRSFADYSTVSGPILEGIISPAAVERRRSEYSAYIDVVLPGLAARQQDTAFHRAEKHEARNTVRTFATGDTVLFRANDLDKLPKLYARTQGPYKIGTVSNNVYSITTLDGEEVATGIAPWRLEPAPGLVVDPELPPSGSGSAVTFRESPVPLEPQFTEESYSFEKILGDKYNEQGEHLYHILWDTGEDTWEPAAAFDHTEMVQAYDKAKSLEATAAKRVLRSKSTSSRPSRPRALGGE